MALGGVPEGHDGVDLGRLVQLDVTAVDALAGTLHTWVLGPAALQAVYCTRTHRSSRGAIARDIRHTCVGGHSLEMHILPGTHEAAPAAPVGRGVSDLETKRATQGKKSVYPKSNQSHCSSHCGDSTTSLPVDRGTMQGEQHILSTGTRAVRPSTPAMHMRSDSASVVEKAQQDPHFA